MQDALDADLLAGLAAFAAVSEAGSFSEAARRLGASKSALSKQVQRLEQRLGARLLQRTTRSLSLTQPGRLAYEHAAQLARSADAARSAVASLTSAPRGLLRVTTSVAYGKAVLLALVSEFVQRYREVEVDVLLLDRMIDFAEEGIDVAIRLADQPPDLSIARPLRPIAYYLVAARGSAIVSRIRQPADLRKADVLNYAREAQGAEWTFTRDGQSETVRTRGRVSVNNSEGLAALVAGGLGVAVVPDYVAAAELKRRRLVRLLPEWSVSGRFGAKVWIVRPAGRAVLPAVRAFSDFMAEKLGDGQAGG